MLNFLLVPVIMGCAMACTIGIIDILPAQPGNDTPSIVIAESFRDDRHFHANRSGSVPRESIGDDTIRADLREGIASRSVPILRSRGMTDEEIKSELLRDFALTEEQVDEILAAQ